MPTSGASNGPAWQGRSSRNTLLHLINGMPPPFSSQFAMPAEHAGVPDAIWLPADLVWTIRQIPQVRTLASF